MSTKRPSRPHALSVGLALALAAAAAAHAQPSSRPDWMAELRTSYETWVDGPSGPLPDHAALGLFADLTAAAIDFGPLPADADVDALEWRPGGAVWFSLAEWAELPGGVRVHPADVVQWNGAAYSKVFDSIACLGSGTALNVDAIDVNPNLLTGGDLLGLSFDTNTVFFVLGFGIVFVFDEDVAYLNDPFACGFAGPPQTFPGLERRHDLDGLASVPRWSYLLDRDDYVSLDTWATVGGVTNRPWSLLARRSSDGTWAAASFGHDFDQSPPRDLDAAWVIPAGIFEDSFETGNTNRWTATLQ
jgi:hypothetical protein